MRSSTFAQAKIGLTESFDRSTSRAAHAFTVVELLVVLAITGLLLALIGSAVAHARHAAYRVQCASHLRQIGLALHQYHGVYGTFPSGCSFGEGKNAFPYMSWCARLLPYIDQEALWDVTQAAYGKEPFFLRNPPHVGLDTVVYVFSCPVDSRTLGVSKLGSSRNVAFTAYLGVEGIDQSTRDGILFLNSRVRTADILDGLSNTLMVGERPPSANLVLGWWYAGMGLAGDGSADMDLGVNEYKPDPPAFQYDDCPRRTYEFIQGDVTNQCDAYHFWSLHGGGAHFLFADGSVRFMSYSAAPILPALATRSGGEAVNVEY